MKPKNGRLTPILICLMLTFGVPLTACSPKAPQPVVIAPPSILLRPVSEPPLDPDVLTSLKEGDTRRAAVGYAKYVLDVRTAIDGANAQLWAIENFYEGLGDLNDGK